MSEAQILRSIGGAASRRATADEAKRKATDDLREFVRQARASKVPITKIASAAGLSRQGVYDLLGERPSS
jgi:DNA invertase Pin-like site-specific DNA recombinase